MGDHDPLPYKSSATIDTMYKTKKIYEKKIVLCLILC